MLRSESRKIVAKSELLRIFCRSSTVARCWVRVS